MQRHTHQHALLEITDRGNKNRPLIKIGIGLQFRHMLVREAQTVKLEMRRGTRFISLDHGFASTRITRYRIHRDRIIDKNKTRVDQGSDQRNAARRIASGISYKMRAFNHIALRRMQFSKTIDPTGCNPMRR